MTVWLKQSTAATVKIGPFIDDTDGKTAETGLTLSQADVRLAKNGGNIAQKNESTACSHDELGYYDCPLDATDTGTLGVLRLSVHESGALPVWQDFMVVPANVWDSFFGADKLSVDVVNWKGSAAAAMTGDAYARLGAPAGASVSADVAAVKAQTADIETDTQDLQTQVGTDGAGLTALPWNAAWDAEVQSECADALNAYDPPTNAEMVARTLAAADYFDPAADDVAKVTLVATTTTNTDMVAAAPSAATVADAVWDEALSGHSGAGSAGLALATASSGGVDPAVLADAVWDEALSGHSTAGSAGKKLTDLANADLSGVATSGALATVAGYIDTEVAAILAAVDTEVAAIKAKTDNLPDSPAATGAAMTLTAAYDAAKTAATQASVNDVPTNAELAVALAAADDAVLLAIADVPTVAEFEARSLPAADYTVVGDLAAGSGLTAQETRDALKLAPSAGAPATGSIDAALAALHNITVADIIAGVAEGDLNLTEMLRVILAAVAGASTGGGTDTVAFRDVADAKPRITATVDAAGNRTAITLDGS